MAKKPDDRRERNRQYVLTILRSSSCKDCQTTDIEVLEFDHLRDKLYNVNYLMKKKYSIKTMQAEIDKCEVVCANCHRKRSYKRQGNVYRCQ